MRLFKRLLRHFDQLIIQKNHQTYNGIDLEILEPRLALDGHGVTRPQLEQTTVIRIDNSLGPNPITFTKSELVGQQTNSFVITQVPNGSVVEKWNQLTSSWHDVSTTTNCRQTFEPTTHWSSLTPWCSSTMLHWDTWAVPMEESFLGFIATKWVG